MAEFRTKARVIGISHDDESITLQLENIWIPESNFIISGSGNIEDFPIGKEVYIEITTVEGEKGYE